MAITDPNKSDAKDTRDVIRDTVKEVFAGIAPLLEKMALTPEKLREANKPYVDPVQIARELRERENNRKQFQEDLARTRLRQEACSHKDDNEKWAICLQHNYPDHMPRGICPLCNVLIFPKHWEIAANEAEAAKHEGHQGVAYMVPAHPLYHIVQWIESKS